jgi:hypothetical protein
MNKTNSSKNDYTVLVTVFCSVCRKPLGSYWLTTYDDHYNSPHDRNLCDECLHDSSNQT